MDNIVPFGRKRTPDYYDRISDEEAARLAMESVPDDPQVTDLIGEDSSEEEHWFALLLENLIRTDREELVCVLAR